MQINKNTKLLIVAPHADDAELGCGGLIQRVLKVGGEVKVLLMTFSFLPYPKMNLNTGNYELYSGEDRYEEMKESMKTLGVPFENVIEGFYDKSSPLAYHHKLDVIPQMRLIGKIERVVKDFSPTILAIPAESHDQDHKACHEAGVAVARPQFYRGDVIVYETFCEGITPANPFTPNIFVVLTKEEVKTKLKALSNYRTQFGTCEETLKDIVEGAAKYRGYSTYRNRAESFFLLRSIID